MKISQVAAQLYTCRALTQTPANIATTLRRVRSVGYTAVQVSGMGPIPEEELMKILDGEGLVCCATHEPGETILRQPEVVVERLQKLRCSHTAYPYPAGVNFSNEKDVATLIEKLDAAGQVLSAAGLTLSYHNHNHEFQKLGGRTILERIYEETNPLYLKAELDTYWVQYGGGENVEWCQKLDGRMPLIHLKDYQTTEEIKPAFCEVGSGNLNFKNIIAAAEKSGCEWFIVEQDVCPGDPVDSLAQSFDYIQNQLIN